MSWVDVQLAALRASTSAVELAAKRTSGIAIICSEEHLKHNLATA